MTDREQTRRDAEVEQALRFIEADMRPDDITLCAEVVATELKRVRAELGQAERELNTQGHANVRLARERDAALFERDYAMEARLAKVPALVEAVKDEHSLLHPDGRRMMGDGSWQPCPVCAALAAWEQE